MDSTSEIAASIIEAGATGNLNQLKAIRKKVGDDWEFSKICDQYTDFSTGWSVLHHAVGIGHFEMCKFLVKKVQVFVDPLTYKRSLSISLVSSCNVYVNLNKIGSAYVILDELFASVDTPITLAAKTGHAKIVEFLIRHGARFNLPNVEGFTPLHYAILNGNMELLELLRNNSVLLNPESVNGTPLQIAASLGNAQAVKSLLSRGANPDLFYTFGKSPLVLAVKSRSFECLKLLLEANANPNLYFNMLSPLSAAAIDRDTKFLKSLLAAKADPNLSEEDIIKPIEEAAMVRNRAAVEILFPLTKRLAHYPNWTVDGIIEHIQSAEYKAGREKILWLLAELDHKGMQLASNKDFYSAVVQYRTVSNLFPSDTTWISKISMWEARLDIRVHAMLGAQKCLKLIPELPVRREIDAAANVIFKKFLMASLAFSLDPYNNDKGHSFRVCLFDYFVWLTQMSSSDEILSLS
ncbi:ankyrin-1-like isoform X2 [Salvia splendens]|uniref:ankyrin-1-like isoform X2 n=1 Tax=Salvia splendens TaxID=180675 RepID=UPI001C253498|nr:ankyrin-1-like isoform X2 [Salvia splendens]